MTSAAVAVARAAGYVNAGTIEFLVDATDGSKAGELARFYFLEMNTRLQVEHPVTEGVTGLDLVRAQLLVASGEPLPWQDAEISQRGHSIEARLYAEDPAQGFMPQAGRLTEYREPQLPGVRVDSGVVEGSEVSVYYDPMIAKVIATAESRALAIRRLAAALRAFRLRGIRSNLGFLLRVLESDAFLRGAIDTGFLDREGAEFAKASVDASTQADHAAAGAGTATGFSARVNDRRPGAFDPWNGIAAQSSTGARPTRQRKRVVVEGRQILSAPMPATVIKIAVKPADAVKRGDVVVLLEAMKMELPLRAEADGIVAAIRCREGELVQADAPLVELQ